MKALKIILLILYLPIYIIIKFLDMVGEFWILFFGYIIGGVMALITILGFVFWFAQVGTFKVALISMGISSVIFVLYKLLVMLFVYLVEVNEDIIQFLTKDIAPV
jgi:hypothetical protein